MYKRLFLQLLLMAGTIGASAAYNEGDYLYTTNARIKISNSQNLLVNGDFSAANPADGKFGWKDLAGATLSTENWQVNVGGGPDGKNALTALKALDTNGNAVTLLQTVPYEPGQTLVVSFKVKAPTPVTSTTTAGKSNYVDVYVNADGSANKSADGFKQVASAVGLTDSWQEVTYSFTDTSSDGEAGFLVIALGQLASGTQVADFTVQQAVEVYDDRSAQKLLSYGEYLIKSGEMPKGADDFQGIIGMVKEFLASPEAESASEAETYMADYKTQFEAYLDANSADMSGKVDGTNFKGYSKYNAGGLTANGDWKFVGGRWGHSSGQDQLFDQYQAGYTKKGGSASFRTVGLPAGRYMFAIDALAYTMVGKSDKYSPDYTYNLPYVNVFIGTDTLKYAEVSNREYNTYTKFADLAAGDTLAAGISYPDFPDDKGGRFQIANPVIRLVGLTNADIERQDLVASVYTQAQVLKERLDSANVLIAGQLPWGKATLKDSVDKFQPLYDASLTYVNAEGVDQGIDIPTDYAEQLRDNVNMMGKAIAHYYDENEPYTDLTGLTVTAKERLDGEPWKDADAQLRSNLQAQYDASTGLIANATGTNDSLNFTNSFADLKKAIVEYERSCAHYPYAADEYVINPFFQKNGGSRSDIAEGWTIVGDSGTENKLRFGKNTMFENQTCAYTSRGNTVYMKNKVSQKMTLTAKGYYEFRCQAYAFNSDSKKYNQLWNGQTGADSARVTGIFVFFGPDDTANKDSIEVCNKQTNFSNWSPSEVPTYQIFFEKTDDSDLVVEFGMDALQNGVAKGVGCNLYGFGGVHVYFWGDKQKYLEDYEAGIANTPVDLLGKKSGVVYNLMGVKVANSKENLPKGIYISDGKKFVIK